MPSFPRPFPRIAPVLALAVLLVLPSSPAEASGRVFRLFGDHVSALPSLATDPRSQAPREHPLPEGAEGTTEGAPQEPGPEPVEGEESPSAAKEEPVSASDVPEEEEEVRRGERSLPRLDVFFPEGDLDLRVNRLIDKVFFEGQVRYNFIDGDISAFLRYRYYGFKRTYQITGFDSVEFDNIEELSDEFERTRGFLFLTQWPLDYHRRTFLLLEIDRLISNKTELQFDTNKTNTFLRVGYQLGTPDDPRSNAIVGERRAEVERLFTPYRAVGPGDAGLTAALTWGIDAGLGDFDYVKVEAEGLKRFELPGGSFLFSRLRFGTFPHKSLVENAEERLEADRYTLPRAELFRLDGRDSLKGISDRIRGTEQLFATLEYFHPWFLDAQRHALWLDWENWYWILYTGYGTTGFSTDVYTDLDLWYPDVGIGFESSFRYRKYTFFLSGIVARAFEGEGDVEASLSIKSYR